MAALFLDYREMLAAIFALLVSVPAVAQDDSAEDMAIFRSQVERLNERYENFFTRQSEQRQYSESVRMGIIEHRDQRRRELERAAEALRRYRLEPKVKPDTSVLEAEHEAEKKMQERIHERYRESFVEHRDQLRRISESARKIPENQDAGLE